MPPLATPNNVDEADMDIMLGLLDSCLSSPRPIGTPQMAGAAPGNGFPVTPSDISPITRSQTDSAITKKQLRMLSKEHLLVMLRDAEKELQQERKENGHLLLMYQAIIELWN